MIHRTALVVVALAAASSVPALAQGVVHVDADAQPGGDGTSWASAFDDLQAGLAAAGRGDQVWVAEGVYFPGTLRTATFQLADGVALYGGFAGVETSLAQRDPAAFVTVLSGDVLGDDLPGPINVGDNVHHVLTAGGAVGPSARVDGFTIAGGNADATAGTASGGGLLALVGARPTVVGCSFASNLCDELGGGAAFLGGPLGPLLDGCVFGGNVAGIAGGGLYSAADGTTVEDSAFTANLASTSGGGAALLGANATVLRASFDGNACGVGGGGSQGGGLFVQQGPATVRETALRLNVADQGGGIALVQGTLTVVNSVLRGNQALGVGLPGEGGGVASSSSTLSLTGCELAGNTATTLGGGVSADQGALHVAASTLAYNAALQGFGGGVWASGSVVAVGSILWGNLDLSGSLLAAQLTAAAPAVDYSCVQGLTPVPVGTGNTGADPLFQDPFGPDGMPGTADDDLRLFVGSPCIDAADNGADANAAPGVQSLPLLDVLGLTRFFDDPFTADTGAGAAPIVDMGAHEYRDCNGNALPDFLDIAFGTSLDCDGDGQPDECVTPLGACCGFDLGCTETTALACLLAGGNFQGCGTKCGPDACGQPCPPPSPAPGGGVVPQPLPPTCVSSQVPVAWEQDPVPWSRDVNPQNGIDDSIDAILIGPFDVVVCYRDCVTDADVALLSGLSPTGTVQRVGRFVTFVAVQGLQYVDLLDLVDDPRVAFIERQVGFGATDEVSVPALKVTLDSPDDTYDGETVEQNFPGIDGTGINIAILDSGVDNDVHTSFGATTVIGGYDATQALPVFGDPDDDEGHGTLVAAIALGQDSFSYPTGYPAFGVARGMAPGAGLIDVKVFDATVNPLTCADGAATWDNIIEGFEVLVTKHLAYLDGDSAGWKVDVISMSLKQCDSDSGGCTVSSDGLDVMCQMVDFAEYVGIVPVAAMGNDGDHTDACFLTALNPSCYPHTTGPSAPAAATRAITVAGLDDQNTVDRSDDAIACYSTQGPRLDDGDLDEIDELKPDVTAPASGIRSAMFDSTVGNVDALGTSMAAPHVAGLAALILQANPDLSPGAVKDLIVCTAEARGTASLPLVDPIWNDRWGWGIVDANEALSKAAVADLSFPSDPADPSWLSPDISTSDLPPSVGETTTVTAMIENLGPSPAFDVHVLFGVHVLSPSTGTFQDIGTKIVDLPVGVTPVSIDWVPADASHQCLAVEIAYGADTDPTNNKARRNLTVASSPVTFQVANYVSTEPIQVGFQVDCPLGTALGWQILFDPATLTLAPQECPVQVKVTALPPVFAPPGAAIAVDVAAVVQGGPDDGALLGGITFLAAKDDCNLNGIDDFVEIAIGMAADCNGNGQPDRCDIRLGIEEDVNKNLIPDSCEPHPGPPGLGPVHRLLAPLQTPQNP